MRGLSDIIKMNSNAIYSKIDNRDITADEFMEKCEDLQEAEQYIEELESKIEELESKVEKLLSISARTSIEALKAHDIKQNEVRKEFIKNCVNRASESSARVMQLKSASAASKTYKPVHGGYSA